MQTHTGLKQGRSGELKHQTGPLACGEAQSPRRSLWGAQAWHTPSVVAAVSYGTSTQGSSPPEANSTPLSSRRSPLAYLDDWVLIIHTIHTIHSQRSSR